MNIQEATKLALKKGLYMTRAGGDEVYKYIRIKPTDTSDCCIIYPSPEYEKVSGKKYPPRQEMESKRGGFACR
ncbi:MAG: hypothetical protein N3A70_02615 [Anoxybacillus gonensis]|nr:hypothetical protein [Anoxybacillus gonensis]